MAVTIVHFYLDACSASPDEQLLPLTDLALRYGYDVNYLGLLARQGKLEARKWDGAGTRRPPPWHAIQSKHRLSHGVGLRAVSRYQGCRGYACIIAYNLLIDSK